jgi:hypothetical protein
MLECKEGAVFDRQTSVCCKTCDQGYGVALPCTGVGSGNDTVCVRCVHGATYSGSVSHEETCQACSHCPPHSYPISHCNVTHNTICECVDGFWYETDKKTCAKCYPCQPGFEGNSSGRPFISRFQRSIV